MQQKITSNLDENDFGGDDFKEHCTISKGRKTFLYNNV